MHYNLIVLQGCNKLQVLIGSFFDESFLASISERAKSLKTIFVFRFYPRIFYSGTAASSWENSICMSISVFCLFVRWVTAEDHRHQRMSLLGYKSDTFTPSMHNSLADIYSRTSNQIFSDNVQGKVYKI